MEKDPNKNMSQLEYVKNYSHQNLGKSIMKLNDTANAVKKFRTHQKEKRQLEVPLNKYIDSNIQNWMLHDRMNKQAAKKERKKFKHKNKSKCQCKRLTCFCCYGEFIYDLKTKHEGGSTALGDYLKISNNIFLLIVWTASYFDFLEENVNDFPRIFTEGNLVASQKFFEAHGNFPSALKNIVFFD